MILVYITCSKIEEAKTIAQTVVSERLAACANIIPQMHSVYIWEGKLCEDQEVVLILKSLEDKYEALAKRVKELHSYDCPCVVAIDVKQANEKYLNWIKQSLT